MNSNQASEIDDGKKEKRRERNRKDQKKCRDKKAAAIETMRRDISELREENSYLRRTLFVLQSTLGKERFYLHHTVFFLKKTVSVQQQENLALRAELKNAHHHELVPQASRSENEHRSNTEQASDKTQEHPTTSVSRLTLCKQKPIQDTAFSNFITFYNRQKTSLESHDFQQRLSWIVSSLKGSSRN